jgi:dihydrofolate reductase
MIRSIVAIDAQRGMANEQGIPWDLPSDKAYFRKQTEGSTVLMGYRTYQEFDAPLVNRQNYVFARTGSELREGFLLVEDLDSFFKNHTEDIWVIGGAKLYEETLDYADELYITHLEGDFSCTKFFPEFEKQFEQVTTSELQQENGITFRYAVYRRKQHDGTFTLS